MPTRSAHRTDRPAAPAPAPMPDVSAQTLLGLMGDPAAQKEARRLIKEAAKITAENKLYAEQYGPVAQIAEALAKAEALN